MTDKFNPWALVPRTLRPLFLDEEDLFNLVPALNREEGLSVYETDNEVVIEAPVPGVPADKVSVSIEGGVLTIKASVKEEKKEEDKKRRYYIRGRQQRQFFYQVQIPAKVISEKAEAEVKDGILTVRLPKVEEAKSKAIKVKVK